MVYKTLGEYEIQTEFFSEGRPVYKRVNGKEAVFLMVPEHSEDWKVSTFSGANGKVFIESDKGTLSPTDDCPTLITPITPYILNRPQGLQIKGLS